MTFLTVNSPMKNRQAPARAARPRGADKKGGVRVLPVPPPPPFNPPPSTLGPPPPPHSRGWATRWLRPGVSRAGRSMRGPGRGEGGSPAFPLYHKKGKTREKGGTRTPPGPHSDRSGEGGGCLRGRVQHTPLERRQTCEPCFHVHVEFYDICTLQKSSRTSCCFVALHIGRVDRGHCPYTRKHFSTQGTMDVGPCTHRPMLHVHPRSYMLRRANYRIAVSLHRGWLCPSVA